MLRRVVVIALVMCVGGVVTSAQTPTPSSDAVRQAIRASVVPGQSTSSKPAMNVRLTREAVAVAPARAPQNKKNIWKTPWPYVIVFGAAAAVVVIAKNSGSGGSGY